MRLLDGAKVVFERDGFLEARISDIAEAAGLSHGSFYHYFESKEQIFREVADAHEELLTAPQDDVEDEPPANEYERILRANRRYLQRYRDNGKIMGVIEEVSRYDEYVNDARMRRQKHFAELWLVEEWGDYDFETAAEQVTRLWANAIGLDSAQRPTATKRKR